MRRARANVRRIEMLIPGIVLLAIMAAPPVTAPESVEAALTTWLRTYEAAFAAKDLGRLAAFYDPEVTIFEGGGVNRGWVDYRDHHLGPELEEMEAPRLTHTSVAVRALDEDARSACVTSEYRLQTRVKGREVDASGLETLIVSRGAEGPWKIRHSHTSSRRRPAASPSPATH
jgi:ketosteroid isomerase-like protein